MASKSFLLAVSQNLRNIILTNDLTNIHLTSILNRQPEEQDNKDLKSTCTEHQNGGNTIHRNILLISLVFMRVHVGQRRKSDMPLITSSI